MSDHAVVGCCVGPVIDIQARSGLFVSAVQVSCNVKYLDKNIYKAEGGQANTDKPWESPFDEKLPTGNLEQAAYSSSAN